MRATIGWPQRSSSRANTLCQLSDESKLNTIIMLILVRLDRKETALRYYSIVAHHICGIQYSQSPPQSKVTS